MLFRSDHIIARYDFDCSMTTHKSGSRTYLSLVIKEVCISLLNITPIIKIQASPQVRSYGDSSSAFVESTKVSFWENFENTVHLPSSQELSNHHS